MRGWLHHVPVSDWLIAAPPPVCGEQRIRYVLFPISAWHSLESRGNKLIFWQMAALKEEKLDDGSAVSTAQPGWNSILSHDHVTQQNQRGFSRRGSVAPRYTIFSCCSTLQGKESIDITAWSKYKQEALIIIMIMIRTSSRSSDINTRTAATLRHMGNRFTSSYDNCCLQVWICTIRC